MGKEKDKSPILFEGIRIENLDPTDIVKGTDELVIQTDAGTKKVTHAVLTEFTAKLDVIDNLVTPSKDKALSANQGVVIAALLEYLDDNKAELSQYVKLKDVVDNSIKDINSLNGQLGTLENIVEDARLDINTINNVMPSKVNMIESKLTTISKNIVAAINEVNSKTKIQIDDNKPSDRMVYSSEKVEGTFLKKTEYPLLPDDLVRQPELALKANLAEVYTKNQTDDNINALINDKATQLDEIKKTFSAKKIKDLIESVRIDVSDFVTVDAFAAKLLEKADATRVTALETAMGDKATIGYVNNKLTTKADVSHEHVELQEQINDINKKGYATIKYTDEKVAKKAPLVHDHIEYASKKALESKADSGHTHGDIYVTPPVMEDAINKARPNLTEYTKKDYVDTADDLVKNEILGGVPLNMGNLDLIANALDYEPDFANRIKRLIEKKSDIGHTHQYTTEDQVQDMIDSSIVDTDNYYTIPETDALLKTKAPVRHDHPEYVTDSEMDKAIEEILVDLENYYTKKETDRLLQLKAPITHEHTGYVKEEEMISAIKECKDSIVDGAPLNLDTLKKIANAIGNRPDMYNELISLINSKASKEHRHDASEIDGLDTTGVFLKDWGDLGNKSILKKDIKDPRGTTQGVEYNVIFLTNGRSVFLQNATVRNNSQGELAIFGQFISGGMGADGLDFSLLSINTTDSQLCLAKTGIIKICYSEDINFAAQLNQRNICETGTIKINNLNSLTEVQMTRGTTADINKYVGCDGQVVVNTTTGGLRVMDGVTRGGRVEINNTPKDYKEIECADYKIKFPSNFDQSSDFAIVKGHTNVDYLIVDPWFTNEGMLTGKTIAKDHDNTSVLDFSKNQVPAINTVPFTNIATQETFLGDLVIVNDTDERKIFEDKRFRVVRVNMSNNYTEAYQVQHVRGNMDAIKHYTGKAGEVVFNTETKTVHAMDGFTKGGTALAKENHRHSADEIDGIELPEIDLSNYYDKPEVDTLIENVKQLTTGVRFTIPAESFLANDDRFRAILVHNLEADLEGFSIAFYNTNQETILLDYQIIDKNTIHVFNSVQSTVILVIKQSVAVSAHDHDSVYSKLGHTHNASDIDGLVIPEVDLTNYYTKEQTYAKTEMYNKTEIDDRIPPTDYGIIDAVYSDLKLPLSLSSDKDWIVHIKNSGKYANEVRLYTDVRQYGSFVIRGTSWLPACTNRNINLSHTTELTIGGGGELPITLDGSYIVSSDKIKKLVHETGRVSLKNIEVVDYFNRTVNFIRQQIRGTDVAVSEYIGSAGQIVGNTTTNTIHYMDGSTKGGYGLAVKKDHYTKPEIDTLLDNSKFKTDWGHVPELTGDIATERPIIEVQQTGGTTNELSAYTGKARMIAVDTDRNGLTVFDGIKVGGYPIPTFADLTQSGGIDFISTFPQLQAAAQAGTQVIDLAPGCEIKFTEYLEFKDIIEFRCNGAKLDFSLLDRGMKISPSKICKYPFFHGAYVTSRDAVPGYYKLSEDGKSYTERYCIEVSSASHGTQHIANCIFENTGKHGIYVWSGLYSNICNNCKFVGSGVYIGGSIGNSVTNCSLGSGGYLFSDKSQHILYDGIYNVYGEIYLGGGINNVLQNSKSAQGKIISGYSYSGINAIIRNTTLDSNMIFSGTLNGAGGDSLVIENCTDFASTNVTIGKLSYVKQFCPPPPKLTPEEVDVARTKTNGSLRVVNHRSLRLSIHNTTAMDLISIEGCSSSGTAEKISNTSTNNIMVTAVCDNIEIINTDARLELHDTLTSDKKWHTGAGTLLIRNSNVALTTSVGTIKNVNLERSRIQIKDEFKVTDGFDCVNCDIISFPEIPFVFMDTVIQSRIYNCVRGCTNLVDKTLSTDMTIDSEIGTIISEPKVVRDTSKAFGFYNRPHTIGNVFPKAQMEILKLAGRTYTNHMAPLFEGVPVEIIDGHKYAVFTKHTDDRIGGNCFNLGNITTPIGDYNDEFAVKLVAHVIDSAGNRSNTVSLYVNHTLDGVAFDNYLERVFDRGSGVIELHGSLENKKYQLYDRRPTANGVNVLIAPTPYQISVGETKIYVDIEESMLLNTKLPLYNNNTDPWIPEMIKIKNELVTPKTVVIELGNTANSESRSVSITLPINLRSHYDGRYTISDTLMKIGRNYQVVQKIDATTNLPLDNEIIIPISNDAIIYSDTVNRMKAFNPIGDVDNFYNTIVHKTFVDNGFEIGILRVDSWF